jgi:hypothetical protein
MGRSHRIGGSARRPADGQDCSPQCVFGDQAPHPDNERSRSAIGAGLFKCASSRRSARLTVRSRPRSAPCRKIVMAASQVGHAAAAVRWHLRNAERFPAMGKARLADARSVRWRRETNAATANVCPVPAWVDGAVGRRGYFQPQAGLCSPREFTRPVCLTLLRRSADIIKPGEVAGRHVGLVVTD